MNFKALGQTSVNEIVRRSIREKENQYVIGIDRGERNLIYVSVIDGKGNIVEQMSLNEIVSDNGYKVDYHKLLNEKEEGRDKARKSWDTIENIKELKEGYMSQVVHKICELVIKYDAIIALEDLNSGFKNGRIKVEKQVYQKFENMLIEKLNFLADKTIDPTQQGGLLHAYQMSNKVDGKAYKGLQNGIIFYIPAWLTSKIDPTTGFVDLIKPKYTSASDAIKLIDSFDSIIYNKEEDRFEFSIDYSNIERANADFRKKWVICTVGDRIYTHRASENNNQFVDERISLTEKFKELFDKHSIDYTGDIKKAILNISAAEFYEKFIRLLALTLQMRNSVTGSTLPEDDYLISPVANESGVFFDSRCVKVSDALPTDADANGAYNIARKAQWAIEKIRECDEENLMKCKISISNAEWLEYAQNR